MSIRGGKSKKLSIPMLVCLVIFLAACTNTKAVSTSEGGTWSPTKPVEVIAPAGPGGGWDSTARSMAKVLEEEKIIDKRLAVVNKPGGGGAIGWSYIDRKKTDDHLLFTTSPPILFLPMNGQSDLGHRDFTPIAALTADYAVFIVKDDSPIKAMNDLVEMMKKDPQSVSVVGGSAPGSMDHMQFVKAIHTAGVDAKNIKYVSSQEGSGMTMLLGGQVDVFSTGASSAVEQVRAGNVRVLGISAPERLDGDVVSEFPTLKEQGIDDEFIIWRGVMGPKDMSPEAVEHYETALKDMMESDAWQEEMDRYGWERFWLDSDEFAQYMDDQYQELESLMKEINP